MIPTEKSAAVSRGLQEAFGASGFEDIRPLTQGANGCLVYRIVVSGAPYLLRVILRPDSAARHFANAKVAGEAGVAPLVRYANVEDKILITDFVDAGPLRQEEARALLPALLRRVHAMPAFAGVPHAINTTCMYLLHKGPALDGFLSRVLAAKVLSAAETDEIFARLAQVSTVYPLSEADWVPSHNDLKQENMLFDGRRLWLADWEAAFQNDRYSDLAAIANFLIRDDEEERTYLGDYFGEPANEYQLARFHVMRQVYHMFCAMGYLWLSTLGKGAEPVEQVPEFDEFLGRVWSGEVNLREHRMKAVYGRVHLQRGLENMRRPRYAEALRIVAGRAGRREWVHGIDESIAEEKATQVGPAGIDIAYQRIGKPGAPAVLLIMGIAAQSIHWPDAFCHALADSGLQVIRFDNRDSGLSTHMTQAPSPNLPAALAGDFSSASYTLADMASDAVGLLDALGIEKAHVVGASMGGQIAQMVAIGHAERVCSMTSMMSTTGAKGVGAAAQEVLREIFGGKPAVTRDEVIAVSLRAARAVGSPNYPGGEEERVARAARAFDRNHDPLGTARQAVATVAGGDRTERLRELRVPALVIHGLADRMCDPSGGRATAAAIPGAELVEIEGMGHDLPPGLRERLAREIADFVWRVEGRARLAAIHTPVTDVS